MTVGHADVLVLGGTGFLGAHIVAAAVRRARQGATMAEPTGPPVVAVGAHPAEAADFTVPRGCARFVGVDLLERGRVEELLAAASPRVVVLAAALASPSACESDPERALAMNADLPRRVARACAASGTRLVHISTDLVFGARDAPPGGFDERAEPGPVSHYGRTKRDGEQAVLGEWPAALVVRLPLLYGNSGGRGRGASDALLEAVERDERPALFTDEWRTPLEVTNAAEALVELAESDAAGILHVAGPDRVTRYELGVAVLEAMGLSPERARECVRSTTRAELPLRPPRPRDVSLSAERARRRLRTRLLGIRDGLARAMG